MLLETAIGIRRDIRKGIKSIGGEIGTTVVSKLRGAASSVARKSDPLGSLLHKWAGIDLTGGSAATSDETKDRIRQIAHEAEERYVQKHGGKVDLTPVTPTK